MCKNSLFIPQSVKSKHSFLICFEIAKELSEFRNYLSEYIVAELFGIPLWRICFLCVVKNTEQSNLTAPYFSKLD